MILEGRSWDCVDWESVKRSALEGAVMGAIGGAVGGVLHKAVQAGNIAKRVAWMIGAAYDVGGAGAIQRIMPCLPHMNNPLEYHVYNRVDTWNFAEIWDCRILLAWFP
jgi:hypothetical protein